MFKPCALTTAVASRTSPFIPSPSSHNPQLTCLGAVRHPGGGVLWRWQGGLSGHVAMASCSLVKNHLRVKERCWCVASERWHKVIRSFISIIAVGPISVRSTWHTGGRSSESRKMSIGRNWRFRSKNRHNYQPTHPKLDQVRLRDVAGH
jgi:hypothetical protein